MVQIHPYICICGEVWAMYGCVWGRRSTNPNKVRVRRRVPVEGSNAKLVSLTHPKHFTMGALSLIFIHRNGWNLYGESIHCMVHASGVADLVHCRSGRPSPPVVPLRSEPHRVSWGGELQRRPHATDSRHMHIWVPPDATRTSTRRHETGYTHVHRGIQSPLWRETPISHLSSRRQGGWLLARRTLTGWTRPHGG